MWRVMVVVAVMASSLAAHAARPLPNVPVILPGEEPPAAPSPAPEAPAAAPSTATLPAALVHLGQMGGFIGAQVTAALVVYALMTLPVVSIITGPLALLGGILALPVVTAATAVVLGDYLSGDRHSLVWALLCSTAGFWGGGAAVVVTNVVLLGLAGGLAWQLARSVTANVTPLALAVDDGSARRLGQNVDVAVRGGAVAPVLLLVGLVGVLDVAALVGLTLAPAILTTSVLRATREEVQADVKLPRVVQARDATPVQLASLDVGGRASVAAR